MNKLSENWLTSPRLSEIKVEYNSTSMETCHPALTTPDKVDDYLRAIWNMNLIEIHEEFYVLLMNGNRNCLGWSMISRGGRSSTIVDVQQVVTLALLTNASSVILAHNHPSGNLKPSSADIKLTKKIAKGLQFMGLTLDDHLIIGRSDYYSFSADGQLQKML